MQRIYHFQHPGLYQGSARGAADETASVKIVFVHFSFQSICTYRGYTKIQVLYVKGLKIPKLLLGICSVPSSTGSAQHTATARH